MFQLFHDENRIKTAQKSKFFIKDFFPIMYAKIRGKAYQT